jgi:iron complex outermembrane receptor protein
MRAFTLLMGVSIMALSSPALAQTESESSGGLALDEIVVTAQKRAENVQEVPIAIAAVSGEELT